MSHELHCTKRDMESKIEPAGHVWPVWSVPHWFHDALGRRRDEEGLLKSEGVLDASGLGRVIGFFIT